MAGLTLDWRPSNTLFKHHSKLPIKEGVKFFKNKREIISNSINADNCWNLLRSAVTQFVFTDSLQLRPFFGSHQLSWKFNVISNEPLLRLTFKYWMKIFLTVYKIKFILGKKKVTGSEESHCFLEVFTTVYWNVQRKRPLKQFSSTFVI